MTNKNINLPQGYRVFPRSIKNIRKIANNIRKTLDIKKPYVKIVRILDILADAGIIELEILQNDCLPSSEWGQTKLIKNSSMEKPLITLKEDVYNKADLGDGFHRFTIAHELGHAFLHIQDLKLSRSTNHIQKQEWYMDSEWQANVFAAELLADVNYIKISETIDCIADKFGITRRAAEVRFDKLFKEGVL